MSRPRTYDQNTREAMATAYQQGATMQAIADHYGLSLAGVCKILKEFGITGKTKKTFDFNSLTK